MTRDESQMNTFIIDLPRKISDLVKGSDGRSLRSGEVLSSSKIVVRKGMRLRVDSVGKKTSL
jgi:hypothetical protein